ncbi:MAG: ABC transporter permease [Gemmatimonadetes bacterium]|nr:ABC transporter permease [Gemmatimonadota bacterium]
MSARSDDDFRDEIEAHLELEADRLAAEQGLSREEARARATRAFGNVTRARERFHEAQHWRWLEQVRQDLAFGLRSLKARPGFTLTALLTIGLGVGVNTAVFTLFYALIARPLPVTEPNRLYNIYQEFSGDYGRRVDGMTSLLALPEYREYQATARSFSGLAAYGELGLAFERARDGTAQGQLVTCNFFQVLGTAVRLGRGFGADECAAGGGAPVAVLSHRLWREAFAGDSGVLGTTIELNHAHLTVVGVAEPGFAGVGLRTADVWMPLPVQPLVDRQRDSLLESETSWLYVIGRLAPGATVAQAQREVDAVGRRLDETHPGRVTKVILQRGALFNAPEIQREGGIVGGAIGGLALLVLVVICANLMNLLLARGIARQREIAIRLALGGSRRRLVAQLITESLLLAVAGGAIGLGLAAGLPPVLLRLVDASTVQLDLSLDPAIFGVALLLSTLAALAFGLLPALHATRIPVASALKGASAISQERHRPGRLRSAVVGIQVAGSTCLVICSAVLLRSALRQATLDPGYDPTGVVSLSLNLPQLGYEAERSRALYADLEGRLTATPGVEGVARAEMLPLLSRHGEPARPLDGEERSLQADWNVISGAYLPLMKIPLVSGRLFTDAEVTGQGEQPAVLSRRMAGALWPGQEPLGRRFEANKVQYRVVGIAADVYHVSLQERPGYFGYLPASPADPRGLVFVLRMRGTWRRSPGRWSGWCTCSTRPSWSRRRHSPSAWSWRGCRCGCRAGWPRCWAGWRCCWRSSASTASWPTG